MFWLFMVVLALVVGWQATRINALSARLTALERRIAALGGALPEETAPAEPAPSAAPLEPLLLDTPIEERAVEAAPAEGPDNDNVLVLDMPLPEASNDSEPDEEDVLVLTEVAPPLEEAAAQDIEPEAAPRERARRFEQWLAENGLAWIAGGAIALGAAFLVSFAAQQSWFTPQVRLACALALAAALLGVSEWTRRLSLRRPPGHPLVSALLAGTGVVALYLVIWAAHGIYGFTGPIMTLVLLALCAFALLGFSFVHGQAIGVLAMAAALFAPALVEITTWRFASLTIYVCGVAGAGFVLAAVRHWPWVAITALTGLYFWFAAALGTNDLRRALALLSFASLAAIALWFRRPVGEESGRVTWARMHATLPAIAISVSSVLLIWVWLSISSARVGLIAGPAWVGSMFVALAASAVNMRAAPAATLAIAIGALAGGFLAYLRARGFSGPIGVDFYPFVLIGSVVIIASALGARPHHRDRTMIAIAGALGSVLLTAMAASSREDWHSIAAWAPLFLGAVLLFAAAWRTEKDAPNREADIAVDVWSGGAAALLLLGIESAFPAEGRSAGHAAVALLLAAGLSWRGWRALRFSALTAAALALAHALSPALLSGALSGAIPLWGALIILAAAAALLYGAGVFASRNRTRDATGEALNSAAVITLLIGAFLILRWFASGGAGAPLDPLSELALSAAALLAAGHAVMTRPAQDLGLIGRWRGHVLMTAGLFYALFVQGLWRNPWWGEAPAPVQGPFLLDTLLIAFAAPAAFAFAAAYRLYGRQREAARNYTAAGGLFAFMWVALVVRRLFHADAMATAPVGLIEGACYGLLFLVAALAVAIGARWRAGKAPDSPLSHDLMASKRAIVWMGVVFAALILLWVRHPWWGGQNSAATTDLTTAIAILMHGSATVLAFLLARVVSTPEPRDSARFAATSAAVLFAWSCGHATIRWFAQRGAIDDGGGFVGLESYEHALWPLLLVTAGAAITARAPGRDTNRSYLYDLQAIWGGAIWLALLLTAIGFWWAFNPWWGAAPAEVANATMAAYALFLLIAAAGLSAVAPAVPSAPEPLMLSRAATLAWIAHLFVAANLATRWMYQPDAMVTGQVGEGEMWSYSAVWTLFGAAVFFFGLRERDALVRWAGLAVLLATTTKVVFFDMARLAIVLRAASGIGLGIVLFAVAWVARAYRRPADPMSQGPGDLLYIKSSGRRERRRGRRYRSP
jgi:uncharacterized membrane protein